MYFSVKSLIKFRLSQNRSQSRSRSRCPDAHLPSFPASPLALCWRWGALSNVVWFSNKLIRVKERGRDHWLKKSYFRRFSASWHRKLSPGFTICWFALNIQTFAHSNSCCATWSHTNTGDMHGLPLLQGRLVGIAKAAGMLLLFEKSRYLWLKLLILNSSNINRYKNLKDNK